MKNKQQTRTRQYNYTLRNQHEFMAEVERNGNEHPSWDYARVLKLTLETYSEEYLKGFLGQSFYEQFRTSIA